MGDSKSREKAQTESNSKTQQVVGGDLTTKRRGRENTGVAMGNSIPGSWISRKGHVALYIDLLM